MNLISEPEVSSYSFINEIVPVMMQTACLQLFVVAWLTSRELVGSSAPVRFKCRVVLGVPEFTAVSSSSIMSCSIFCSRSSTCQMFAFNASAENQCQLAASPPVGSTYTPVFVASDAEVVVVQDATATLACDLILSVPTITPATTSSTTVASSSSSTMPSSSSTTMPSSSSTTMPSSSSTTMPSSSSTTMPSSSSTTMPSSSSTTMSSSSSTTMPSSSSTTMSSSSTTMFSSSTTMQSSSSTTMSSGSSSIAGNFTSWSECKRSCIAKNKRMMRCPSTREELNNITAEYGQKTKIFLYGFRAANTTEFLDEDNNVVIPLNSTLWGENQPDDREDKDGVLYTIWSKIVDIQDGVYAPKVCVCVD
ncbi:hypothetical protein FHG87_005017 [Trinorchestia longiramus]|nr:hypothetical protein FHG87_005017 [Trinorchestia longiramus]